MDQYVCVQPQNGIKRQLYVHECIEFKKRYKIFVLIISASPY